MAKKKKEKKKGKKKEATEQKDEPKVKVNSIFLKERVITENSNDARELYNQSRYGSLTEDGKVQLSLLESMYLLEKGKLIILDGKNKEIPSRFFVLFVL